MIYQLSGHQHVLLVSPFETPQLHPTRLYDSNLTEAKPEDRFARMNLWSLVKEQRVQLATPSLRNTRASVDNTLLAVKNADGRTIRVRSVHVVAGDVLVIPSFWWVATKAGSSPNTNISQWIICSIESPFLVRSLHGIVRNNLWFSNTDTT